jgi:hypothetical protein
MLSISASQPPAGSGVPAVAALLLSFGSIHHTTGKSAVSATVSDPGALNLL